MLSRSGFELNEIWRQQATVLEADERVRALERRWKESGSPADADAYARALHRAGRTNERAEAFRSQLHHIDTYKQQEKEPGSHYRDYNGHLTHRGTRARREAAEGFARTARELHFPHAGMAHPKPQDIKDHKDHIEWLQSIHGARVGDHAYRNMRGTRKLDYDDQIRYRPHSTDDPKDGSATGYAVFDKPEDAKSYAASLAHHYPEFRISHEHHGSEHEEDGPEQHVVSHEEPHDGWRKRVGYKTREKR